MAPLAPLFASFAAGILLGRYFPQPYSHITIALIIAFLIPLAAYFMRWRYHFLLITPLFLLLGLLFIQPSGTGFDLTERIYEGSLNGPGEGRIKRLYDVTGVVSEQPFFTGRYTDIVVSAESIRVDGRQLQTGGGVRLRVKGEMRGINKGDTVRFLGSLRALHNFGNPGEFDYVRWLRTRGIAAKGYVRSPRGVILLRKGRFGPLNLAAKARSAINGFIGASGASNPAILKALITGEKEGLSPEVRAAYARTGTAHVLAISGLHVGILAYFSYSIIMFLLRLSPYLLLRINIKKTALLASLLPVFSYGLIAGFSRPTERAVIMAAALMIAVILDRGKSYYNTLALAGLVILLITPTSLFEASFQLSFLAVFFILFLTPKFFAPFKTYREARAANKEVYISENPFLLRIRKILSNVGWRAVELLLVTIAASIGTWPVLAYYFNSVSTVGLGANLLVLPLTTLIVPTLFCSSLLIPISATLAGWGFHAAGMVAALQLLVVKAFAGLGFASISLSRPTAIEVLFIYLLIFTLFSIKKANFYRFGALISAIVLVVLMLYPYLGEAENSRLRVTFISVGLGDAALVEFPRGKVMLIDSGGFRGDGFDTGRDIIAPLLRYKNIKRIDYMVLSHAQNDHMGGFKALVHDFPTGVFWWNGRGRLGALKAILDKEGVAVKKLGVAKKTFDIDGVKVLVLPVVSYSGVGINDSSLVVRLTYGGRSFLFPGDIEARGEEFLSKAMKDGISADVLKAPHHGSSTSSTMGFLRAVGAKFTVISLGRDNYLGFPHEQSLGHYAKVGARVLRTDRDGAVEVSTDGQSIAVTTYGR